MKFRIRFADQIVGIFALIAITFLAGILILMGANQRWFAKNYHFTSRFKSGSGLSIGMAITLRGFQIGKVSSIALNASNEVDIGFYIFDTYYDKVLENSILELASSPLGLGGGLLFHPGKAPAARLSEHAFVPSLDLPEGQDLVKRNLVERPAVDDIITRLLGNIEPILKNVNTTLSSIDTLVKTVNETFKGDSQGPVGDMLADLKRLTLKLNSVIDDTSKRTNDLLESITVITGNVAAITGNVEETTAAIKDPTGLVTKVLDPQGSIKKILDDDNQLFNQIENILNGVNETINQLKAFSKFVNSTSPQISGMLTEGRQALDQGKDVLEGIKNNPLIRGGIPKQKEQPATFQSYRDEVF
ncbi:MAG: MlaD family protein [Spirochaetota bacterium]